MMSREQFQQGLKAIAVQKAREILANQDENRETAKTAVALFQGLRDAPVWRIAETTRPEEFNTPPELWSEPVTFIDRRKEESEEESDDDT